MESNLEGYLGVFFLGEEPRVYFYISKGNDALSFRPLNNGNPVLVPTIGTGGIRDPSIVAGAGKEVGKKWYIIGTDLDIAKHPSWDSAQRKASLGIYVWESTDLINWGTERLVKVENDNAGMVWAPDAIWDATKGEYLVHWSSRFYSDTDRDQEGDPITETIIRYCYTADFMTFSSPQTLIDETPNSVIDLALIDLGNNQYARFLKEEEPTSVYMERSDSGLFGTWFRPGGTESYVRPETEGPYAYKDNLNPQNIILLLDFMEEGGYRAFVSSNLNQNDWKGTDGKNFPTNLRHGSVIGISKKSYDLLNDTY